MRPIRHDFPDDTTLTIYPAGSFGPDEMLVLEDTFGVVVRGSRDMIRDVAKGSAFSDELRMVLDARAMSFVAEVLISAGAHDVDVFHADNGHVARAEFALGDRDYLIEHDDRRDRTRFAASDVECNLCLGAERRTVYDFDDDVNSYSLRADDREATFVPLKHIYCECLAGRLTTRIDSDTAENVASALVAHSSGDDVANVEQTMRAVYVVTGQAGAYSDHVTWLIAAFDVEADAKREAAKLTEQAEAMFALTECRYDIANLDWDDSIEHRDELRRMLSAIRLVDPRGWDSSPQALRGDLEYHVTELPLVTTEAP